MESGTREQALDQHRSDIEPESGVRKPRPKFGWYSQASHAVTSVRTTVNNRDDDYPLGSQWRIGFDTSDLIGEVIEYGSPPADISIHKDLVHLHIVVGYKIGYSDYWSQWQLHERVE